MAAVTTGRRLTDQGKERKQQLLDVAASLFAERGYQTTRIADICEAAGVAKGLFYWYFETKEALFAELVRSMRQQLRRAQADAMDPEADAMTRIRQGTEESVRFMAEHNAFFALLEAERADEAVSALLREGSRLYIRDSRILIEEAQRDGTIPDEHDPELLALGVLGAVSQFCHYQRTGRSSLPVEELARFVGTWVVRALGALPAPPAPAAVAGAGTGPSETRSAGRPAVLQ
jgi:AcrR family transcriptional regulator